MSQEKLKEILIALQDNGGVDSATKSVRFFLALAEINRIVMECLPEEMVADSILGNEDDEMGEIKGHNKAIAEFKANWEGK